MIPTAPDQSDPLLPPHNSSVVGSIPTGPTTDPQVGVSGCCDTSGAPDRLGGPASGHPVVPRGVPDRHFGDGADSGRDKFDEINLRQRACRTTGSPPRREVEKSLPTFQNEPVS